MKKGFLFLILVTFFACAPKVEYYKAPVPVVVISDAVYSYAWNATVEQGAIKTKDDFISKILKNQNYVKVSTSHKNHKGDFQFDADITSLLTPLAFGKREVPFVVKDSTGVFTQAVYPIYILPDTTPPTVTFKDEVLNLSETDVPSPEFFTDKLNTQLGIQVTVNDYAASVTHDYTYDKWDISVEEGQETVATFVVKDALGNESERYTVRFIKKADPAAPSLTITDTVSVECGFTKDSLLTALEGSSAITVSPGGSAGTTVLSREIVSDMSAYTSEAHFCESVVNIQYKITNTEQASKIFNIPVTVVARNASNHDNNPIPPITSTDLIKLYATNATTYTQAQFETLLKMVVLEGTLPQKSSSATVDSYYLCVSSCLSRNIFTVAVIDGYDAIQFDAAGSYPITMNITTATGQTRTVTGNVVIYTEVEYSQDGVPSEITVDNKRLYLTHLDSFDSWEMLQTNWDIGNPGIERPEIGNPGIQYPTLVEFPDGIKGYSGDRYKQPYWSPKAVEIKDGKLLIKVFFDKSIQNKNVNGSNMQAGWVPGSGGTYDTTGYGLAGAIHSKRQFPCGLFITKIKHSWGNRSAKTNAHWDAWWAESNNPFSRAYGEKELFMPEGGESRIRRAKNITTSDEYTDVPTSDRGLNGQQVYEYDMYEWVGNNQSQWQVLHSWAWYGGYPGWEDRYETRGGDNNYWSTSDNLRGRDNNGISGTFSNPYQDGGQASSGDWFYLAMLVTPEKVVMWNFPKTWNWDFSQSGTRKSQMNKTTGAFGNSGVTAPFMNADTYAPIQVKYSSELGDWGNMHNLIYNAKDRLTQDNPDIMHAEFFAFYAWDTVKYTSVETDVAE